METTVNREQIEWEVSTEEGHLELIVGHLAGNENLKYEFWVNGKGYTYRKITPKATLLCITKKGSEKIIILEKFRSIGKCMEAFDDHVAAIRNNRLKIEIAL